MYKSHIKTLILKHQLQHGMAKLNCMIDSILYEILKIKSGMSSKNMKYLLIIFQFKYISTKLKI